jgi:hypothetical protein
VLCGGGEAVITYEVSDTGEVFLFDSAFMPQAVVVFAVGPGACKLDALLAAPFEQGGIDKLTAVVAVYARKGEREGRFDVQQGLENPPMGLIKCRAKFYPA